MRLQSLICIVATFSSTLALTITENTITDTTYAFPAESITIEANVFWSIWNNLNLVFGGDLNIMGDFYITTGNNVAIISSFDQSSIVNSGTMSFNAAGYASYTLNCDSFDNTGDMFFINSGRSTIRSTIQAADCSNTGSITFGGESPIDQFGINGAVQPDGNYIPFLNSGDIYLNNSIFSQVAGIVGEGCFHIQGLSRIVFKRYANDMSHQTFYMVGPQAQIKIDELSGDREDINIVVAGFGNGNLIMWPTSSTGFTYNIAGDGKLIIYFTNIEYIFSIGLGYSINQFSLDFTQSTISYTGPVPDTSMPTNCKVAPPIPIAPRELPQSSSTVESSSTESTSSTISSDSQTSEPESNTSSNTISSATSSDIWSSTVSDSDSISFSSNTISSATSSDISSSTVSDSNSISFSSSFDPSSSTSSRNDISSVSICAPEDFSCMIISETSSSNSENHATVSSSGEYVSSEMSSSISFTEEFSSSETASGSGRRSSVSPSKANPTAESYTTTEPSSTTTTEVSTSTEPGSSWSDLPTKLFSSLSIIESQDSLRSQNTDKVSSEYALPSDSTNSDSIGISIPSNINGSMTYSWPTIDSDVSNTNLPSLTGNTQETAICVLGCIESEITPGTIIPSCHNPNVCEYASSKHSRVPFTTTYPVETVHTNDNTIPINSAFGTIINSDMVVLLVSFFINYIVW